MKRPNTLLRILVVCCLLLIAAQYAALTWLAPHYVMRLMEHALGGQLVAAKAWWSFPSTMTLTGVRLARNTPGAAISMQRAVMRLRGVSIARRALEFEEVEIERPLVRMTRTKAGTVVWPEMRWSMTPQPTLLPASGLERAAWGVVIHSLKVDDGTVEFLDEHPVVPFHGLLDHISFVVGPITMPQERGAQVSFAVRGEVAGHSGHAAPAYCSGWLGLASQDVEASCQLEPIALAAFEPYYHGPAELRVYTTTLRSTSQWSSRANDLKSRIQLELGHLSEGDLSIRGRTLIDFKKLTSGQQQPRLTGELTLTGPFNTPADWHAAFTPGDEPVLLLLKRLLDRGVEVIKVPVFGGKVHVSITSASKTVMTDIEAASREVQEALEILAFPIAETAPEEIVEATPTAPPMPTNGKGIVPAPTPEPPATSEAPVPQQAVPSTPTPQPTAAPQGVR
ncbi:MAG: DUF748 domain-containing protein [Candidatus Omnitrophica bacterium]|nr:DUF748 domain-containing protein [Candidatus Omnitrophota bacterium]